MSGLLAVFMSPKEIKLGVMASQSIPEVHHTSSSHQSLLLSGPRFRSGFTLNGLTMEEQKDVLETVSVGISAVVLHVTAENFHYVRDEIRAGLNKVHTIVLDESLAAESHFFQGIDLFLTSLRKAPVALGKMSEKWNERGQIIGPSGLMGVQIPSGDGHGEKSPHISRR